MSKNWQRFIAPILAFALVALAWGCPLGLEGSFEILDQPLQGSIEGQAFNFVSGYAEDSSFEPGVEYDFQFYNIAPVTTNPWDFGAYPFSADYLKVSFSVPQAVGTYPLYWDYAAGEMESATLYDTVSGMNTICTEGSIRIDSINAGVITGAIAARLDDDYVNGNFSVSIAP